MHFNRYVSPSVRLSVCCSQSVKLLLTLNHMVQFDQILHHSARNNQFPFHTFLLAPEIDYSTFTTDCVHYRQLIYTFCYKIELVIALSLIPTTGKLFHLSVIAPNNATIYSTNMHRFGIWHDNRLAVTH